MVENLTFEKIVVYDWQATCGVPKEVSSDGHLMLTPFKMILLGVKFLVGHLFWTLSRFNGICMRILAADIQEAYDDTYNDNPEMGSATRKPKTLRKGQNQEEEDYFNRNQTPIYETIYFACDKQYDLYNLNETNLDGNSQRMYTNCST